MAVTQPDVETTNDITKRWLWLLDVVFGATAAFGFENLQQSIRSATSTDNLVKQIIVALALYIFFFI